MLKFSYSSASQPVRIEYPLEWDIASLSALDLTITDDEGTALLEDEAMTLYTATTLDGAAVRYADTVTLDAGADDLEAGDAIFLSGSAGSERRIVKGYDSSGKVVTLETILDNQYDDGDSVYGLFATVDLDLSDTDVYTEGMDVTLEFVPTGTGAPFTLRAEIIAFVQVDLAGFERDLSGILPRVYDGLKNPENRLPIIIDDAKEQLRRDMLTEYSLDILRLRDQSLLFPSLRYLCAVNWTMNGDEDLLDEEKRFVDRYKTEIARLAKLPTWSDPDNDKIKDDGEVKSHPVVFYKGW